MGGRAVSHAAQTTHLVEVALQLGLWRTTRRATIIGMTEERATESDAGSDLDLLDDEARHARIRELLANPGHHGGDSVRFIREMRDNRFGANWRSQDHDAR